MVLFGRLSCDFNAVKHGQVSASEGEVVQILEIQNGYAVIRKENKTEGQIPSYFLEVAEDSVDEEEDGSLNGRAKNSSPNHVELVLNSKIENKTCFSLPAPYQASFHLNQILPIRESPQAPEIVAFKSIVPSEGPLVRCGFSSMNETIKF